MARPGYKEARQAVEKAIINRDGMRVELDNIETLDLPESLKIIRRGDWQRGLDQAEIELTAAQAAFDVFNTRTSPIKTREYFDARLNLCISMSATMSLEVQTAAHENGVSIAEIVRRGLALFLKERASTKEN